MDYRKYENALKKAKVRYNEIKDTDCSEEKFLLELFPELKESKDRIRKGLIKALSSVGKRNWGGIDVFESIAWLEKQGEQKVPINDFNAKDWYVSNVDGKIHDMTYNPTDKAEPKFKVGDFIVNDYCMGKVMKLTNDTYLLDTGQGIPFSCEHNAHLWTIQDAKDGDVLVDVYGNIGIFQKNDDFDWSSYCSLGPNGGFRCFAIEHELDGSHPATKEQRDLLFKKIEEAGYQWDSEKKELKLLISNGGDFESNNSKQKSTWSEEDEKIITALIEGFRYHQLFNPTFGEVPNAEIISWIKSLKERLL